MADGGRTYQCGIVGLGAMGSAAAYHLARRGLDVIGFEQFEFGHPYGSSHGQSRVFRTTYEDPFYVQLAVESLSMWRTLETQSDQKLLDLCGLLVFSNQGNPRFADTISALRTSGIPYEIVDGKEASRRTEYLALPDKTMVLIGEQNGYLRADLAVNTMRMKAVEHGAQLLDRCKVTDVHSEESPRCVATTQGDFRVEQLIVTAGPWLTQAVSSLRIPIVVTREQKVYFNLIDGTGVGLQQWPVFCDYETGNYGFPSLDNKTIKVAADHAGIEICPNNVNRVVDTYYVEDMACWLNRVAPQSMESFASGSVCLYSTTPDRDFILGRHPKDDTMVIAGGFSGHGFKFSVLIGDILADLVIHGTTHRDIHRFDPSRFDLINDDR